VFDWAWVAIGGALGSVLRYGTTMAFQRLTRNELSLATLAVNLLGSFLIGWLAYLIIGRGVISVQTRLIVVVGVLGGFTTFSTFSLETLRLVQEGGWFPAAANIVVSVGGGLLAAWAGFTIASSI